jgi:hypothetical protein
MQTIVCRRNREVAATSHRLWDVFASIRRRIEGCGNPWSDIDHPLPHPDDRDGARRARHPGSYGYSRSPRASIATNVSIRRARVSGRFAVWIRCRIA